MVTDFLSKMDVSFVRFVRNVRWCLARLLPMFKLCYFKVHKHFSLISLQVRKIFRIFAERKHENNAKKTMRKYVCYLMAIVLVLSSCGKSPEDKANALIKEAICKTLYNADSYDPVSTIVDSAFTPFDDPEFYKQTLELYELGKDIENYKNQAKKAEENIAHYQDMLRIMYSNSSKLSLKQAQEEYDNALAKKSKAEERVYKLIDILKAEIQQKPLFIGFKAKHRYRAKSDTGYPSFGDVVFLFDKDITQIVYAWDLDNYEYQQVQYIYEYMQKK